MAKNEAAGIAAEDVKESESGGQRKQDDRTHPIEQLAAQKKTDRAVLAGVMEMNCWASGKRLEEAEFDRAVSVFLSANVATNADAKRSGTPAASTARR